MQDEWTTVVNRPKRTNETSGNSHAQNPTPRLSRPKPAAVLVKVQPTSTYADTLRAVRTTAGLNPADFGATVTSMWQTQAGHQLVEMGKGTKSELAAGKLGVAIVVKLGERVGGLAHLGQ